MKIWAVYFSPTGGTRSRTTEMADYFLQLAITERAQYGGQVYTYDFTLPDQREDLPAFEKGDVVFFGTPVYAGRLPSLMLNFLNSFEGNSAIAIPISCFGNRACGYAPEELRGILSSRGFNCVAAAALVSPHPFSPMISGDRPDEGDRFEINRFVDMVFRKIMSAQENPAGVPSIKNGLLPYADYYKPLNELGEEMDIRKLKPSTKLDCTKCGYCVSLCPLGSIDPISPELVTGKCMKCYACIRNCPVGAKEILDADFEFHVRDLEEGLAGVRSLNIFCLELESHF